MKFSTNKDSKISVSAGSMDFLINEVEQKRRQVELLSAENRVMNNFFKLIDKLSPREMCGEGHDNFHRAKKEFEDAIHKLENPDKSADS